MSTHVSCIGRGLPPLNCAGYGDLCLDCTGVRDQDWAAHAEPHARDAVGVRGDRSAYPASGPCGQEGHCEAQVGAARRCGISRFATCRPLGIDPASSWQTRRQALVSSSRLGSGGNAYNCTLPSSDGCAATSWFESSAPSTTTTAIWRTARRMPRRLFAAFDRHKIACGLASDASNQNSTICPPIGTAALTATPARRRRSCPGRGRWCFVVQRPAQRNFLRGELDDHRQRPGTTFTDPGLANGFAEYYRVQAVGTSAACEGRLSNCQAVTPQPSAGLRRPRCRDLRLLWRDRRVGRRRQRREPTTTVKITSSSEPAGETITLTRVSPGSASYVGRSRRRREPPRPTG